MTGEGPGPEERVVAEVTLPEGSRHWGTHVREPALLPGDGASEVRVWNKAGQLRLTEPLDPSSYNRVQVHGRFREGSTLQLILRQGERKQSWDAAVSGREDPPGAPLRTVTFDLRRPRWGVDAPERLILTVDSPDCEVHALTLTDTPPGLRLPPASRPEMVGLDDVHRAAVGVTAHRGVEARVDVRPGDELSFWYGVPETLPPPDPATELRVALQGGGGRREATFSLRGAGQAPRQWQRAVLPLADLAGGAVRVTFQLTAAGSEDGGCLVADAWVAAGAAGADPPFVDLVARAPGRASPQQRYDETFRGVQLDARSPTFEGVARVSAPAGLLFSGCFLPGDDAPDRRGTLRVTVIREGSAAAESIVVLDGSSPWWSGALPLPDTLDGEVRIRVEAELAEGDSVALRELLVENALPQQGPTHAGPQILLISLDTLREDLGGAVRTPNLDALAAEAQVWSPHYSGASWTKPSHATLLTGYRGETHGCVTQTAPIAPGVPLLAERFQRAGLRTAALVYGVEWLDPRWGFGRGFDEYRVVDERVSRQVRRVVNWVAEHRAEPFFYFFHSFEAHSDVFRLPYESPGTTQGSVDAEFGTHGYGCSADVCATRRLQAIRQGDVEPVPDEERVLRELYARGVEETDRALGELFDQLRRAGLWEDLLVVVTSDHGEALLEQEARVLHGIHWESVIRVPLIVKWPGTARAGTRGGYISSAIDVAPTLLRHAGLPLDDQPGTPLQELDRERPILVAGWEQSLVWRGWKASADRGFQQVSGLYRLTDDPGEEHDLAAEAPAELERLVEIARDLNRADLSLRERYEQGTHTGQLPTLSEEELQQLRALGY
jgi:arylsulfatase A-like enzyme